MKYRLVSFWGSAPHFIPSFVLQTKEDDSLEHAPDWETHPTVEFHTLSPHEKEGILQALLRYVRSIAVL